VTTLAHARILSVMNDELLLGTREAARRLGIFRAALYARTRRGTLPARKLGGRLVFLPAELKAYLRCLPRTERRAG
jgi:excisionase family DNA binding protein